MQEFSSNRTDARHVADKRAVDAPAKQRRLFVAKIFKTIDPVRRGETIKELAA
ncbi:MAG TPA: hypothetical protein PLN33_17705 [Hyphomonadaceae bacterium]|jgi:hypothetical protein|nr:hypothetical protein [Hyphomonadaceae bacterium]HPN07175.1 hypothetical protein [Hyphomonadaceae bacterium]